MQYDISIYIDVKRKNNGLFSPVWISPIDEIYLLEAD